MDNLIIPASLRDAVVEYLANRPWKEVHQVMPHLINLEAAEKKDPVLANANNP